MQREFTHIHPHQQNPINAVFSKDEFMTQERTAKCPITARHIYTATETVMLQSDLGVWKHYSLLGKAFTIPSFAEMFPSEQYQNEENGNSYELVNLWSFRCSISQFCYLLQTLERQESDEYLSTPIKIKLSSLYLVNCCIHEEQ